MADHVLQRGSRKDEKLILTTQYLFDNVLGAISEAKFNMKRKNTQGLQALISELKEIYNRGNYKNCLKENEKVDWIKNVK